ncbi:MAG: ornithine cyclodeaminase family protein [Myxococcales bacterium]
MALVLTRRDVASLLTLDDCIAAVEDAFRRVGTGEARPAGILGFPVAGGGFHVKAAALGDRFAAKVNGNFSANPALGLPAIQGAILLSDSGNGRLLAVLDSIEITILRTGAATAVAAKHLARPTSRIATICGCGNQGRVQLRALARVLPLRQAFVYDIEPSRAAALAYELSGELRVEPVSDLAQAVARSDVCVTCTPSRKPVLHELRPGMFVAAVGADSPDKQELHPALLASAKVVVDSLDQCAEIGELHHAIEAGSMHREDVHAELGEIVAGRKRGRTDDEEITVFDSTGTALQDVAAASSVYAAATLLRRGIEIEL